ncbi:MAG: helix-turn-helix domain-containing protein [Hymenobacter sp.]|nr:MAG: helix-turn-helix domain-containing protein [Hymenobacter sp.]
MSCNRAVCFFLAPGQVHQWHLGADADGIVVFFEFDFYQFRYPERALLALPFFDTTHSPALYLPAESELKPLFEKLLHEYQASFPNQAEVRRAYLALLLELATRHYPAAPASTEAGLAQSQIRQFGALLNQHYRTHHSVRDYAARLHLTANYLNALCRRMLGQTTSDLIHARVVLEARRLLTHSALSVGQVADELGFDDPSYFGRYSRKYVGQSPEAFRQKGKLSWMWPGFGYSGGWVDLDLCLCHCEEERRSNRIKTSAVRVRLLRRCSSQ